MMSPLALSLLWLAAAPGQGTTPPPPVISGAQQPVSIETEKDAASLCVALTPVERMRFRGDAVERGKAQVDHETARREAVAKRYRASVQGKALAFKEYDPDEGRLSLTTRNTLSVADGHLRLWAADALTVEADVETAQRILDAQKRQALSLVLTFEVATDGKERTPCTALAGQRISTLNVDPVSWEYRSGEVVLARGGEDAERPLVSAAQGARRRVEVSEPIAEVGAGEIRRRLQGQAQALDGCYASALAKDPDLGGSLIAEVRLTAAGGVPKQAEVVIDSIRDEGLSACVKGVLARTVVPGGAAQRVAVPIRFVLEAPGAAPGAGAQGSGSILR